jgi:UDP-galactopyranose mutase
MNDDVLVVGAGLAGSTVARICVEKNKKVLVVNLCKALQASFLME